MSYNTEELDPIVDEPLEPIEEEKKEKPVKVKDTMVKKTYTRPVKK